MDLSRYGSQATDAAFDIATAGATSAINYGFNAMAASKAHDRQKNLMTRGPGYVMTGLRAAGINPLAAFMGKFSPTGGPVPQAASSSVSGKFSSSSSRQANTARDAQRVAADLARSQKLKLDMDRALAEAKISTEAALQEKLGAEVVLTGLQGDEVQARTPTHAAGVARQTAETERVQLENQFRQLEHDFYGTPTGQAVHALQKFDWVWGAIAAGTLALPAARRLVGPILGKLAPDALKRYAAILRARGHKITAKQLQGMISGRTGTRVRQMTPAERATYERNRANKPPPSDMKMR
jgi:hypothetical protein